MGRYFPLFGEEWGVYFFARKSLVSGATVARILVDAGSATRASSRRRFPGVDSTRDDFPGPGEPSTRRLVERQSRVRSLNETRLPLEAEGRREAPSSNARSARREYLLPYLFISLLEIYRGVRLVALLSIGNMGRLGKSVCILEILFFKARFGFRGSRVSVRLAGLGTFVP